MMRLVFVGFAIALGGCATDGGMTGNGPITSYECTRTPGCASSFVGPLRGPNHAQVIDPSVSSANLPRN